MPPKNAESTQLALKKYTDGYYYGQVINGLPNGLGAYFNNNGLLNIAKFKPARAVINGILVINANLKPVIQYGYRLDMVYNVSGIPEKENQLSAFFKQQFDLMSGSDFSKLSHFYPEGEWAAADFVDSFSYTESNKKTPEISYGVFISKENNQPKILKLGQFTPQPQSQNFKLNSKSRGCLWNLSKGALAFSQFIDDIPSGITLEYFHTYSTPLRLFFINQYQEDNGIKKTQSLQYIKHDETYVGYPIVEDDPLFKRWVYAEYNLRQGKIIGLQTIKNLTNDNTQVTLYNADEPIWYHYKDNGRHVDFKLSISEQPHKFISFQNISPADQLYVEHHHSIKVACGDESCYIIEAVDFFRQVILKKEAKLLDTCIVYLSPEELAKITLSLCASPLDDIEIAEAFLCSYPITMFNELKWDVSYWTVADFFPLLMKLFEEQVKFLSTKEKYKEFFEPIKKLFSLFHTCCDLKSDPRRYQLSVGILKELLPQHISKNLKTNPINPKTIEASRLELLKECIPYLLTHIFELLRFLNKHETNDIRINNILLNFKLLYAEAKLYKLFIKYEAEVNLIYEASTQAFQTIIDFCTKPEHKNREKILKAEKSESIFYLRYKELHRIIEDLVDELIESKSKLGKETQLQLTHAYSSRLLDEYREFEINLLCEQIRVLLENAEALMRIQINWHEFSALQTIPNTFIKIKTPRKVRAAFDLIRPYLKEYFEMYIVGSVVRKLMNRESIATANDIDVVIFTTTPPLSRLNNVFGVDRYIPNLYHTTLQYNQTEYYQIDYLVIHLDEETYQNSQFIKSNGNNRDFTINNFYADQNGLIYNPDPRGLNDLRAGIIRTILPADDSFRFDPVRIFRAIKLMTEGFSCTQMVDASIRNAIFIKEQLKMGHIIAVLKKHINTLEKNTKRILYLELLHDYGILLKLFPDYVNLYPHPNPSEPFTPPSKQAWVESMVAFIYRAAAASTVYSPTFYPPATAAQSTPVVCAPLPVDSEEELSTAPYMCKDSVFDFKH